MKNVVVFLIVLSLAGCSAEKRLARLLEKHPLPETVDTFYSSPLIIYRDTIIFREIKGDTIRDSILIPVRVDLPEMRLKKASMLAEATATIRDNTLGLELIQYDTVFMFLLDSALRHDMDTVFVETVREVPKLIPPKPFWRIGFLVLAGLILVTLVLYFALRK